MYSLHLASSPWFLLLIAPGLLILWRQYAASGGLTRIGRLLLGLQATALILLCLSLAGPELRRHHVSFHNPTVLILRDQSGSFAGGAALGLGRAYLDFQGRMEATYAARKFDVRVVDFAERAWPAAGFPDAPLLPDPGSSVLTSLAAPADFVDSASIPNLQAVFLFSDGRANLDSGRASRTWRVPVHPVVFPIDSISEVQPVRVSLDAQGLFAAWETVGRTGQGFRLQVVREERTVLSRELSATMSLGTQGQVRIPWKPEVNVAGRLRAVLRHTDASGNPFSWNDTLAIASPAASGRRIFVLLPVRSLDEKGMIGALRADAAWSIDFFTAAEAASLALRPEDQVWAEAGVWTAQPQMAQWLKASPAKVVLYARAGQDGMAYDRPSASAPRLPGLAETWAAFPPASEVKAAQAAGELFPDEVLRLKGVTALPMLAPPPFGRGTWVEVRDGGRRGLLMGRLELSQAKRAFFFCLPAIWGPLSDPQGDFAVRENIAAYIRAARDLADLDDGRAHVLIPERAIAGVPFAAAVRLPETTVAADVFFGISGPAYAREWPRPAPSEAGEWKVKDIGLPLGHFRAWLRSGADTLWRDSLEAAPPEALELARVGFDETALSEIASHSGGAVLRIPSLGAEVTPLLPDLPAAQIRVDRADSIRLYNTLSICLLILALLSISWYLRKKWNLD